MDIKLQNKIARFIELSKKFSKSVVDVFGKEDTSHGWTVGTIAVGSDNSISYQSSPEIVTPPTRAELILEEAEEKATLSNEYDEYISLQNLLGEYFKINNKLTQD